MIGLPPLGTIDGIASTDTASPYYLPPAGTYQNDAGQIVSKSTPNTSGGNQETVFGDIVQGAKTLAAGTTSSKAQRFLLGYSVEDAIIIVIGLVLITAGIFGFEKTSTVITGAAGVVKKGVEAAAA